jgi:hypothetical protein
MFILHFRNFSACIGSQISGEEVKLLQKKMKQLFLKQKNKGGIIDLEVCTK